MSQKVKELKNKAQQIARPDTVFARGARTVRELIEVLVLALAVALIINIFMVKMFYIPSSSMEDTLLINDKLIVNRFLYGIRSPRRGEIIVFKSREEPYVDIIKRCVGVAGDVIEMRDRVLYVNEIPFAERPGVKYKNSRIFPVHLMDNYGPITVPDNCIFMMGDNRYNSQDSRFWGSLPLDHVKGKAVCVYWPPRRIRLLRSR